MNIKNEIMVGIIFFIAVVILGYYTIIMSGDIFESRNYYSISVIFPNVDGLGPNDKVKVNGVLSGIVENLQLEQNAVYVNLKMYNRFNLYENYKIKIKNETALGGRYISINPGSRYKGNKRYDKVNILENLQGDSTQDIVGLIAEFIGENRENIYKSINNIKEITAKINSSKGTLGKLVNDNSVHQDTDSLIQEIRDTIEDSREQAPITSFIRAALTAF
ncbi:MAG: MlaD family protein [Spirochaetota bacterium]|nr:MlaD family protein [Spirochaetota bacterium]